MILTLFSLLPFIFPPVPAQDSPAWGGAVLDLVGKGIPGVEILAYPAGRESTGFPSGIFRTDEQGRFRLSGLTPGGYFLALNKPGYQILLAQVNTRWISRLTLTLVPGGQAILPASDAPADSMIWVLRCAPHRSPQGDPGYNRQDRSNHFPSSSLSSLQRSKL